MRNGFQTQQVPATTNSPDLKDAIAATSEARAQTAQQAGEERSFTLQEAKHLFEAAYLIGSAGIHNTEGLLRGGFDAALRDLDVNRSNLFLEPGTDWWA